VTTLQQHIDELDPQSWATLTKRVAERAVAAAGRLGTPLPPELVAAAAMTGSELIEHRERSGPARRTRPTARMKLIEADRLRAVAERGARDAHQDKQDAEAGAAAAQAESLESARATDAARERARAAEAQAAQKDVERAAERLSSRQTLERVRGELAQVRADAAAEIAAARQRADAAEARAERRAEERAAERGAAQETIEQLRGELAQVRADAAAEIAAARQRADAAEARAERRAEERAAERGAAQETIEQLRGELAQVRVDAAAEIDAARQAAGAEVAGVRVEAQRLVSDAVRARGRAEADAATARRRVEAARAAAAQLLTIPIPPAQVRPETRRIENALTAVHQLNYVLEVGMTDEVEAQIPLDLDFVRSLVSRVQGQAGDLSHDLGALPARFSTQSQVQAAAGYARAAARAYRVFLQRIETAAQHLRSRDRSPDAEIIEAVRMMLADPALAAVTGGGPPR
jgi:colicin import membrane protein